MEILYVADKIKNKIGGSDKKSADLNLDWNGREAI